MKRWIALSAPIGLLLVVACGTAEPIDDRASGGSADQTGAEERPEPDATGGEEWEFDGPAVRLGQTPFHSDSVFAIARAEGLFEDLGIEVEVVESRSPSDIVGLVATGEIDAMLISTSAGSFRLIDESEGLRLVAAATVFDPESCANGAVLVRDELVVERDLEDPEALRGVRIGGSYTALNGIRLGAVLLERLGLEADDVELVEVERASMTAAMLRGDVDAVIAYEPWLSRILDEVPSRVWFTAPELLPGELSSAIVFGPRLLEEDRELGKRVLAAYLRAEEQFRQGPTDRNVEIVAELTQLDAAALQTMCWPALRADGRLAEAAATEVQEFGVEIGQLDRVLDPTQLWDHALQDEARRFLEAWQAAP
jgi:NitT/TauT family transport system substrate-binding protein